MNQPRIRRQVARVDISGQGCLFEAPVPFAGEPVAAPNRGGVRFCDPDPALIRINGHRLDEVLRQLGQHAPLKIRQWLSETSFASLESSYPAHGRPAYAPRAMVGVILSGIMVGLSSLRDLEQHARLNLGCWWISGNITPDHSVLGRFIQRHADVLTEQMLDQWIRQVLNWTGSDPSIVAGDGTVIEAVASRYRRVRAEALAQALDGAREAAAQPAPDPGSAARVAELERAQAVLEQRQKARRAKGRDASTVSINPGEPDTVVQPLKNTTRHAASYKPCVLANSQRVIVAAHVHASSETAGIAGLLDRAQAHGPVQTGMFDAGFFSAEVITAALERGIELLCPEGQSFGEDWNKRSQAFFPKNRFQYEADQDRYGCPADQWLVRIGRYQGNAVAPGYVEYGTSACAACAMRAQCTRSAEGRRVKRYAIDEHKDALRARMADSQVRERYRQRQAMVEPVFSQLRGRQGLRRFRRRGLAGVRVEFALHAMAYNLSRALACTRAKPSRRRSKRTSGHGKGCLGDLIGLSMAVIGWLRSCLSGPHQVLRCA